MKIIAISGKAASGKDTISASIKEVVLKQGGIFETISLAEKLKDVTSQLWNVDPEYLRTYEGKATLRSKLIQLGGFVRDIDPNTWVQLVIDRVKRTKADVITIPDLRFLNELYRLIREFGTDLELVRVVAPASVRMERMGSARAKEYVELGICSDISETQFDFLEKPAVWFDQETLPSVQTLHSYARSITNAGTFEELDQAVLSWATRPSMWNKEQAGAAMNAAYTLSKRLGPEARLILETLP